MKQLAIKKLYYSISEVSEITSLKQYVLRYWETEFPDLKPSKNRAGNRIYRSQDINLILLIKKLLYTDKYTIEGARQKLRALKEKGDSQIEMKLNDDVNDRIISEIRSDLQELLSLLEGQTDPGVAQSG